MRDQPHQVSLRFNNPNKSLPQLLLQEKEKYSKALQRQNIVNHNNQVTVNQLLRQGEQAPDPEPQMMIVENARESGCGELKEKKSTSRKRSGKQKKKEIKNWFQEGVNAYIQRYSYLKIPKFQKDSLPKEANSMHSLQDGLLDYSKTQKLNIKVRSI